MPRYNPKEIEPRWQKVWADSKIYEASNDQTKPKRYVLEYFPYPSGAAMHVGHVRNYTIGDVVSRHARMNGYNVLHPMGWDAFGLPAENYAIKTGISPQQAIAQNTTKFKQQLMTMGFSYDWSREFASSDPDYYRWTQWFFLLLHKRGLAYRQESSQWWCPVDKTVLANEQVENGHCWRCGSEVEKKALPQWFFKITDYADRLAKDLDDIDWSTSIKSMQQNWIGRSTGAEIDFKIVGNDATLKVFTTRADTLYGATFMVLAPEHPLLQTIVPADHKQQVENYQQKAHNKSDIERQETNRDKTGVFTGAYATNPINGEEIPIWTADYVLMGYGTGAIMAVPAHDERDYAFARQFGIAIKPVVAPAIYWDGTSPESAQQAVSRPAVVVVAHNKQADTYCLLDWDFAAHGRTRLEWPRGGMDSNESLEAAALREFTEETGYDDVSVDQVLPASVAAHWQRDEHTVSSDYRIVILSVNSTKHTGIIGTDDYEKNAYQVRWLTKQEILNYDPAKVDEVTQLVTKFAFGPLPLCTLEGVAINSGEYNNLSSSQARQKIIANLAAAGLGHEKVNYRMRDWLISRQRYWGAPIPIIHCPKDGAVPVPEDQLPVILPELTKFEPSGDGRSPLANVPEFVNTTCPTCGGPAERETDTMDGFACSSWYFLRFADPHNNDQAFDPEKVKFWLPVDDYIGGAEHAVMHLLYARMWTKVMQDAGLIDFGEPFKALRNQGMILAPDGQKMSKSKGNTIQPDELIEQGYGADTIRIMELFIGPWNQSANWSVEGMGGSYRFLQRIWNLVQDYNAQADHSNDSTVDDKVLRVMHKTIKKVSSELDTMGFNTAIAAMMEAVNELHKLKAKYGLKTKTWHTALTAMIQLLAPFAPHITEELWQQLNHKGSVHTSLWPKYDDAYLVEDTMTIAVQVNGKLRGEVSVASDADEATIIATAQQHEKVATYLQGKDIKKSIVVPTKLINFVV